MISVTVEGSLRPCTELPRGERRTVALTERVQRLIDRGYFTLITTHYPEQELVAEDTGGPYIDLPAIETLPGGDSTPLVPTEPSESALKADWQAWLDHRGVWYPDNATKAELIAAWHQVVQQQDADNG